MSGWGKVVVKKGLNFGYSIKVMVVPLPELAAFNIAVSFLLFLMMVCQ